MPRAPSAPPALAHIALASCAFEEQSGMRSVSMFEHSSIRAFEHSSIRASEASESSVVGDERHSRFAETLDEMHAHRARWGENAEALLELLFVVGEAER